MRPALGTSSRLLMLSPDIGAERLGGVELSGRLAWERLRRVGQSSLFCYGPGARGLAWPDSVAFATKAAAIRGALSRRWPADHVLIWHLHLLRLLPLFRVGRARVTLMLHGIEAWHRHDPMTRMLLGRVDRLLSNSEHTWRRFLEHYPRLAERPHRTLHLGLGEPVDPPPPPAGPPAALILGRLAAAEDYKGHRELLAAWPLVRARLPEARIWIAGDGDLRPALEHLAGELNLGESVRFFGRVSEQHKQALLAECRCLAMPSRGEGFGLVYLEAMRLGRPCLVSTRDAGREVVAPPEAGLAADPGDPAALAEALHRLLTPGAAWAAWSAQARRRYEREFTTDHYWRRLDAALDPHAQEAMAQGAPGVQA